LKNTAYLELNLESTRKFCIKKVEGLLEVENQLYENLSDSCDDIYNTCKELIQSGGKRLRPILVLSSCQCFGPLNQQAIQTSVACEFIHMASLIHDDVIDESDKRRNRPTVNAQMGNQVSILMGDYLFAKSFEILSKNKLINSMKLIVEAIMKMCDGEIVQSANRFNFNQTIQDYYDRIYQKTGILISACCKAGAIIGGGNETEVKCFEIYGRNIGYAFQIIDDILDFIGSEEILGKPVGCDLKEGHITLPILKLIENKKYKDRLQKLFNINGSISQYYNEIVSDLKDSGAIQYSYNEARMCINKAKKALKMIEDSYYKQLMMNIADNVLMRMH
jgi:heptaprenyl diphosphate synthase